MSRSSYLALPQDNKPVYELGVVGTDAENPSLAPSDVDAISSPLLPLAAREEKPATSCSDADADKYWGVAFKINAAITLIGATFFGVTAVKALANDALSGAGRRRLQFGDAGGSLEDSGEAEVGHALNVLFVGAAAMVTVAGFVTAGMLLTIVRCGRGILISSYATFTALMGALALLAVFVHPAAGVFPAIMCAAGIFIICRRRNWIAFSGANLKVAALAIKTMPWTIYSSLLMGVVQFCWSVAAAIAALGSYISLETVTAPDGTSYRAIDCAISNNNSCMCNGERISDEECHHSGLGLPLMIFWLLSMTWGCVVIKNVVACTVTGSVASWWFTPNEDPTPVKGAFHRATHSSFGSLCKAAVVQATMAVVTRIARRVMRFIPCASFLMSWANAAVRYILSYTVAFIGIYGLGFNDAERRVRELFFRRGVIPLANDGILAFGLRALAASATFAYVLISFVLLGTFAYFDEDGESSKAGNGNSDDLEFWSLLGAHIFGAVTCMLLLGTVLEVLRSGFKAVFVCFVQDPHALAQKHEPELHEELNAAWRKIQCELLASGTIVRPLARPQAPEAMN